VVCGGVIRLRSTRPDLRRPFRMPGSPVLPVIGMLASVALMLALPAETWVAFVIWMIAGFLIYFGYSRTHSLLATSAS
jgi:APA family basic amino acid/polyamine antiporter